MKSNRNDPLTLVTGATGLVGNNVVRLLLERGERVRVLVRDSSDPRPLAGLELERASGDVRDPQAVERALAGVDRVIHSAGYVRIGYADDRTYREINIEGTRHVAEAARAAGAQLIHVSSVDAIGPGTKEHPSDEDAPLDPSNRIPYVLSKHAAEQVVLEQVDRGLDARIVNPVFMLGPWDWKPSSGRLLRYIAHWGLWISPRGGNDFCDVRDVASGILAASERGKPGRRYILGGEPLSYFEAFRMFADIGGRLGPVIRLGPIACNVSGALGSLWGKLTGHEPDMNLAATTVIQQPHHYSYARAAAELGYAPRPARQAAEDAWEWFKAFGYVGKRHAAAYARQAAANGHS